MPPFNPNISNVGATTSTAPMKDQMEYAVARKMQPRAFRHQPAMNPGAKRYMRQQARLLRRRQMGGPGEVTNNV